MNILLPVNPPHPPPFWVSVCYDCVIKPIKNSSFNPVELWFCDAEKCNVTDVISDLMLCYLLN